MLRDKIIRAWKDPEYRLDLSEEEQAGLLLLAQVEPILGVLPGSNDLVTQHRLASFH